ncbi:MAG: hypothetical protein GF350_01860, partial [Chitinivibrionales bacterium]|nr:hypothetical protein [Chitinivibrionales bacterium]
VVDNPHKDSINSSNKVARCRVPQNYTRAELSSQRLPTNNKTYVYRWSYYLPEDFYDNADLSWSLISQWKSWPCGDHDGYDTQICFSCGIFNDLSAGTGSDRQFTFRWRAEPDCNEYAEEVRLGTWTEFVMEIKWTNNSTGYMKLWMNNERVKELDNIKTLFDDFQDPDCNIYWAVGIYTNWTGTKDFLDVYIDNIEINDTSGLTPSSLPLSRPNQRTGDIEILTLSGADRKILYRARGPGPVSGKIHTCSGKHIGSFCGFHDKPGRYSADISGQSIARHGAAAALYIIQLESGAFRHVEKKVIP